MFGKVLNMLFPSLLQVGADGVLALNASELQRRGVDIQHGGFSAVSLVATSPTGMSSRSGGNSVAVVPAWRAELRTPCRTSATQHPPMLRAPPPQQ